MPHKEVFFQVLSELLPVRTYFGQEWLYLFLKFNECLNQAIVFGKQYSGHATIINLLDDPDPEL